MELPASSKSSRNRQWMTESLEQRLKDLGLSAIDGNKRLSIELPVLKYGYRKQPLTWEQLQTIILVENNLAKLSRSSDQQRDYEIFRCCLKQEYQSVLDYVLITKFGMEKIPGNDGRCQAYPLLKDIAETKIVLVPNDFPYFMDKGITHFILWKTRETVLPRDIEDAKKELGKRMKVLDFLHWINPPHLQSLPDIDHVHILCRLENETDTEKI